MKKFMSILSIFVMSLLVISPSASAQNSYQDDGYVFDESFTDSQISNMMKTLSDGEISKIAKEVEEGLSLQRYVDASGDFIEFDFDGALKGGVDPLLVQETKEAYERANEYLKEQQPKFNLFAKAAACGSTNRYEGNWVAGTLYIDSCTTNKAIAILNGGAGASGLLALLPFGAPVAGIAVAIHLAGASVLSYNNAAGNGIQIRVLRNPLTQEYYPYWVKPL